MTIIKKIKMDVDGVAAAQTAWPIIHTSMEPSLSTEYYGTDNETDFQTNKLRLPTEWIYNNKIITYNFNRVGLRMNKELDQINSKYLIAFGCSHTVGVGVAIEDTWPYLLAQEVGIDYVNSAVSGSSVKLTAINFFNMLDTVKELPNIVAFAWPSSVRYTWYSQGNFLFYLPRYASDRNEFKYQTKAYNDILLTDVLTTEAIFYRNMVKTTCVRLGIKYCETSFDARCDFVKELSIPLANPIIESHKLKNIDIGYLNKYFARDIRDKTGGTVFSHVGIGPHLDAKNIIIKQL